MTIKARVSGGRLFVDESTDLPEGAEIELLPLDPGDWLDECERTALHAGCHCWQCGVRVEAADQRCD